MAALVSWRAFQSVGLTPDTATFTRHLAIRDCRQRSFDEVQYRRITRVRVDDRLHQSPFLVHRAQSWSAGWVARQRRPG